jgi:hypothetical protein
MTTEVKLSSCFGCFFIEFSGSLLWVIKWFFWSKQMLKIIFLFLSIFLSTSCTANDLVIEVVPLNNRFASDIQPLISPFLEDSELIIANRSSLIIKATPLRQKEIKKLINQLDTRLDSLTITVIQSKTQNAQSLNTSANINLNFVKNRRSNFSTDFRGRFGNTNDLNDSNSRQQIQTLDGKSAYIKIGKTHPVENTQLYHSEYDRPIISSNTQLIEASTGFLVTPRLSGKQVTLEVTPWSDKMNNDGTVSTQSGHSTLRVNLGQWVEIGGVDRHSQQSSNGILSHAYSTANQSTKTLIKVDKN